MVIYDRILLGIVAGLAGNFAKNTSDSILNKVGVARGSYAQLGAAAMAGKQYNKTKIGLLAGHLTDFIMGAGLGIPIVYLFTHTGKDYAKIKGASVGFGEWLILLGLLGGMTPGGRKSFPLGPKSVLSSAWHHMLYGVVAAEVITRFGASDLFPHSKEWQGDTMVNQDRISSPISR